MFVDHRHRLIFFHNPKCAGTCITQWARSLDHCSEIDFYWSLPKYRQTIDLAHLTPLQSRRFVDHTVLSSYRILIVYRDPRSRLLSSFFELLRQPLGVRFLGERGICSYEHFLRAIIAAPFLVESEDIPWLRPQIAYSVPGEWLNLSVRFTALLFEGLAETLPAFLEATGYVSAPLISKKAAFAEPAADEGLVQEALASAYASDCDYYRILASSASSSSPHSKVSRIDVPAVVVNTVINVDAHAERFARFNQEANARGLAFHRIAAITPNDLAAQDCPCDHELAIHQSLLLSHLLALAWFVGNTESEFLFVAEDDLDLSGMSYWTFSLDDLAQHLPCQCGLVQLSCIWSVSTRKSADGDVLRLDSYGDLMLRPHRPSREWGTAALLWRRSHAIEVLRFFGVDLAATSESTPDLSKYPGLPVADVVLFDHRLLGCSRYTFTLPILACYGFDDPLIPGSVFRREGLQLVMHQASRQRTLQRLKQSAALLLSSLLPAFNSSILSTKSYPFVSLFTPTRNRASALSLLEKCILLQDYPRCRMQWVVVDDSDRQDVPRSITLGAGLSIRHHFIPSRVSIGYKRNLASTLCRGEIIVCLDDDDYYPPQRVSHAVDLLSRHNGSLIAGSSVLPIYFLGDHELWQWGPLASSHATAATLAYRRLLHECSSFDEKCQYGEESGFLQRYTLPMVQLDPWQSVICMAHQSNTVDKRFLLSQSSLGLMRRSSRLISSIIPAETLSAYIAALM